MKKVIFAIFVHIKWHGLHMALFRRKLFEKSNFFFLNFSKCETGSIRLSVIKWRRFFQNWKVWRCSKKKKK